MDGMSLEAALNLTESFCGMLDSQDEMIDFPDDFLAFLPVKEFPARLSCVTFKLAGIPRAVQHLINTII